MKKARIILAMIALSATLMGTISFKAQRRQLNNLFYRTTGDFFQNGVSRNLTYAALSPYRNFRTDVSEFPTHVPVHLYESTTQSTTTIGGAFYFITVVTGARWPPFLGVYDDAGQ
jgi:hypothetical protein